MTLSAALEAVSRAYVPGVVAFYEKHPNDPWQRAHDDLEKTLDVKDETLRSIAAQTFVNTCVHLIETFKRTNMRPARIGIADAFHIGDEERFKRIDGLKSKYCAKCESTKDLKIVPVSRGSIEVQLLCGECIKGTTTRKSS